MTTINIYEARNQLSRLVELVESGAEREIVLARNGKPAARLVPLQEKRPIRFGLARGEIRAPDDIHAGDAEIQAMFDESLERDINP